MNTTERVINNVKYLRNKLGLSTKQLSNMIGKNDKFIDNLEAGKRQIRADLITALAHALNVKDTDLITKEPKEIEFVNDKH